MATTSLWIVGHRLDKVLAYAVNKEKTYNENYNKLFNDLHNVINYTEDDFKTEKLLFVSGVNCNEKTAYQEMTDTKEKFGKENGIVAYHGYQSFKEGEVTPEQAHLIGIKLAEELWGDKYEVVVSTHLNTNHIHNHFVINSVSFVDGKKFSFKRATIAMLRKTSDDICREYNLSTVQEKPCGSLKIDYTKYYKSYIQKTTYYTIVKDDVDYAIRKAKNYNDFENILKSMNYEITIRAGKISLLKPPYKRNIRIERSFGEEYSIKNIKEQIELFKEEYSTINNSQNCYKKYTGHINKNQLIDRGSFYKLYLYYCYLLNVFPKTYKRQYLTEDMKNEIKKMDKMSEEMKFLAKNKIKTGEELLFKEKSVSNELKELINKRGNLRKKKSRCKTDEEKKIIYNEIFSLSEKIKILSKEVQICKSVEERSSQMKKNLLEMKEKEEKIKNERKENLSYEYGRRFSR